MANIRVDADFTVVDGQAITFRSPVDCSQITGLIIYYPDSGDIKSAEFQFADAHGNNVGDIDNLFAEDVLVKVVLDIEHNKAFVQNADTNSYIEKTFVKIAPQTYTATPSTIASVISSAQSGATIQLSKDTDGNGEYELLTLVSKSGLRRAEDIEIVNSKGEITIMPALSGTITDYPENLTIVGDEDITMAGISITSGVYNLDQYTTTDTLRNKIPGGLTLKNLNLSDSICLRNCTMDGLNILDCHLAAGANININPNTYKDKFGKDSDSTSSTISYSDNAATCVSNVVIRGNTIEDAYTSEDDTKTSAILVYSVNNVAVDSNLINKAPFNGVQVRNISGSHSTGKIGISHNEIHNTGSRSIRLIGLRNANVFVCSNKLHDANLVETANEEIIKASDGYNTTYSWLMVATTGSGSNSYRENNKVKIAKMTVGDGITVEGCSIDERLQYLEERISYGTTSLTSGSSALTTGNMYLQYE